VSAASPVLNFADRNTDLLRRLLDEVIAASPVPPSFEVVCPNGSVHTFDSLEDAEAFAEWGHICVALKFHDIKVKGAK
jgi:hypothetical protein